MTISSATGKPSGLAWRGAPSDMVRSSLACFAILLASVLFFHFNTAQGIGVLTDSTRYMGLNPWAYDAPLYHWLLVLGTKAGLELTRSATIIAVFALIANVVLIFMLLTRATRDWIIPALGTSMVVFAPSFVTLHASAMSEAPFLTLLLLTLWAALDYFETGSRRALLACSLLLGLATLTRFTAPPLGAAIALVILLRPATDSKAKLADAALLAAIGGAIFLAWVVYSQFTAGRSIGRELWFYGNMGPTEWRASWEVMTSWILPDQFPLTIRTPLLVLVIGIGIKYMVGTAARIMRLHVGEAAPAHLALPAILGLFFIFYLLFILLSVSIEANLSLTGRYGFPAYVVLAMLVTLALAGFHADAPQRRIAWHFLLLIALIFCGLQTFRSIVRTPEVYRDGYGFQHVSWRSSPTLAAVRKLPADARLLSNGPDIIAFHTGRPAEFSPHEYMLRTQLPEPGNPVELQLDRVVQRARTEPIYIVIFDAVDWRHYLAAEETLIDALHLGKGARFADGRIYRVLPTSPPDGTAEAGRQGDEEPGS